MLHLAVGRDACKCAFRQEIAIENASLNYLTSIPDKSFQLAQRDRFLNIGRACPYECRHSSNPDLRRLGLPAPRGLLGSCAMRTTPSRPNRRRASGQSACHARELAPMFARESRDLGKFSSISNAATSSVDDAFASRRSLANPLRLNDSPARKPWGGPIWT
jgi:hypothetical protein